MTAYTSQYQGQSVRGKTPSIEPSDTHTTYSVTNRGLTPNPNTYTQFCTRENHSRYLYTSVYVAESCYGHIHSYVHGRIMSGVYTRLYTWENHVIDLYAVLYTGGSCQVHIHVSIHGRINESCYGRIQTSVHGRIISGTYTPLYTREDHVVDLYTVLYTGESCQVPIHVSIRGRFMLWTYTQFCTRENMSGTYIHVSKQGRIMLRT